MTHVCACSCLASSRTVNIVDIYIKCNDFLSSFQTRMLHFSFPCERWPITPLRFPHPWGKVVGSGKTADECFLKVPLSLLSLHFYPFLPWSHPKPLCFWFFPTVPCSICCEKDMAGLLRSNRKGKWEPGGKNDWHKRWMKKWKGYFHQDDALKEQCRTVLNDCWWKTNGAERNSRGLTEK